jgi:dihydroflavonol-4-reductase
MAKVLVTGASGFIGSHLVTHLVARGDEVTCLVRRTSQVEHLARLGVRLVYGDVTDAEGLSAAVAGQEIVYHLAGLTLALNGRRFFRVNRDGTRNIAHACALQSDPPVLLMLSSLAAVGPASGGRPKIESDPPLPVSTYGQSKLGGEREAQLYADRVPTTIVRPPIVLGEGDHLGLPMFKSISRIGLHLVPGLSRNSFSLIHADDLGELIILAAERGKRLPTPGGNGSEHGQGYYHAACERDVFYFELGEIIGKALGRNKVFCLPVPKPVIWAASACVEGASQLLRKPFFMHIDKTREATAGSWTCSPQRAMEELGFSVKAPIAERLRQTAEWYRNAGWL